MAIDQRLKSCAPYARDLMVLVAADPEQNRDFLAKAPMLNARGVDVADLEKLRPVVGAEGYSLGEAYGYLRVVPRGTRPLEAGPRDILVTEGSFEDLGLVAGLVTALPQNLHSHVNLRLREKGIPNARIPDVYDNQAVLLLSGKLAHLTVAETQARLEPATLEDAEAFWKQHRPPARPLRANLDETRLRDFTVVAASEAIAYGVKAANLGELYRVLPPANRAAGLRHPVLGAPGLPGGERAGRAGGGVPGRSRRAHRHRRPAPGPEAAARRHRGGAAARGPDRPAGGGRAGGVRRRLCRGRRPGFAAAATPRTASWSAAPACTIPPAAASPTTATATTLGPSACLSAEEAARLQAELDRRRAELAANPQRIWLVEVIDDLDSDLTRERTVARALRRVYASLWNERAFEEREYWSMDHRQAFMGVAVNPSFVLEQLDAVAVTNVPVAGGAPHLPGGLAARWPAGGAPARPDAGGRDPDVQPRPRRYA